MLCLQRLEREKDPLLAVRAWAACGLADRGWRLVVAGRGSLRTRSSARLVDLGVSGRSSWWGSCRTPSRCSAAPRASSGDGARRALRAVRRRGHGPRRPGRRGGGWSDLETLADSALLFEPGDERACAERLRQVADDPAAATLQGRRDRDRQRQEFSLARHVDRLEALYASCLARS